MLRESMRHRWFRGLLVAFLVAPTFSAAADDFYIGPHLQNVTPDGATIIWETPEASVGVVQYGAATLDREARESAPSKIHRVRLTGLEPDKEYLYRVTAGPAERAASFKTAPVQDRPITFAALGDTRRWEDRWEATRMGEHVLQWKPEFFLHNGDLVREGHRYELWPEHFQRFSDINTTRMIVSARGNHEGSRYRDTENDWYAKYHEAPGTGEPFSAFDWGNAHFVLISHEDTAKAAAWLDEHLANVQKKWVIVVQHYPVYCTGYRAPDDSRKEPGKTFPDLATVLDKYNVPVNMSGHTHIYERSYPLRNGRRDDRAGVTYIVNGGDINANYPDSWSALTDDPRTQAKPTYSLFQCQDDRIDIRTFCWSQADNKVAQIDRVIVWRDEAVPRAVLASLAEKQGSELPDVLEELGAMIYGPAVEKLASYLSAPDPALRRAAASALRAIGTPEAATALAPLLSDGDLVVRRQAARALEIALPKESMEAVRAAVLDAQQDDDVRASLLGALQLHAEPTVAREAALAVLQSEASPEVRRRAAYAAGVVAQKTDAPALARLVNDETDPFVLMRVGFALNNITGNRVSLDSKGAFATSQPGHRRAFVQQWLGG